MTGYIPSALTPDEQAKVPTPGFQMLSWDEIPGVIDAGIRVYGYLEDVGQITRIPSRYRLEEYEGRLSFAWSSSTTLSDLIRKA